MESNKSLIFTLIKPLFVQAKTLQHPFQSHQKPWQRLVRKIWFEHNQMQLFNTPRTKKQNKKRRSRILKRDITIAIENAAQRYKQRSSSNSAQRCKREAAAIARIHTRRGAKRGPRYGTTHLHTHSFTHLRMYAGSCANRRNSGDNAPSSAVTNRKSSSVNSSRNLKL